MPPGKSGAPRPWFAFERREGKRIERIRKSASSTFPLAPTAACSACSRQPERQSACAGTCIRHTLLKCRLLARQLQSWMRESPHSKGFPVRNAFRRARHDDVHKCGAQRDDDACRVPVAPSPQRRPNGVSPTRRRRVRRFASSGVGWLVMPRWMLLIRFVRRRLG